MPIYEYRCDDCGAQLERMQKLSDPPLSDCPECGQAKLRKLVSAPTFRLKGSGWYETDFKQSKQKNLHESGEGKASKPEAGTADATNTAAPASPSATPASSPTPAGATTSKTATAQAQSSKPAV